ncbi:MAG: serine hydroxymethyltransferase [Christensenellales bacterium]
MDLKSIREADGELYESMLKEFERQQHNLELIASENIVSEAVLAAAGTFLTNKYAEGYPDRRYYGGCQYVDVAEKLAIERAKKLFGVKYANVQPHCGSNANFAAYYALLKSGDTVLGMTLADGGHLTHGAKVNMSGKLFNCVGYGINPDTELIDYDEVRRVALECKPQLIVAGASAYPREIDYKRFREIADEVGAYLMADIAHVAGLIVAGVHQSPVGYAHVITSTTHKTLRGPRGGLILCDDEDIAKRIDKAVFPGSQGGPLMHIIAAKAVAFKEAMTPEFVEYQKQIVKNAKAMANRFVERGLKLVSGGTDNHMMLLNLTGSGVNGKQLESWLDKAHITVNKNSIPNEPLPPSLTSGIRVGTPAVTTRGMKENDMVEIADMIADVIQRGESAIESVSARAIALCDKYPIYKDALCI